MAVFPPGGWPNAEQKIEKSDGRKERSTERQASISPLNGKGTVREANKPRTTLPTEILEQ